MRKGVVRCRANSESTAEVDSRPNGSDYRRFMWATVPKAAKKWSHGRTTKKRDWVGRTVRRGLRRNRK